MEAINGSSIFNINTSLVTPNPTKESACLYKFLLDNFGKKLYEE